MTVELERDDLIGLFSELGYPDPGKWSEEKLAERLQAIPEDLEAGTLNEPESSESKRLLEEILNVNDREDSILIKPSKNGKKSSKKEETLVVEDKDPDDEDGDEEEVEEVKEKRPRGRPKGSGNKTPKDGEKKPKAKKAKKEKVAKPVVSYEVEHSFTWKETEKPVVKKLTEKLAKEFRDMERFPRDRGTQENRLAFLRRTFEKGEFQGAVWASALCEEDGKTYRVNGKHTSQVACEFFEGEKEVNKEIPILVRRYSCPTMEDVAHLYNTFDSKHGARNKNDVLRTFAASHPRTAKLESRPLSVITSGIAFARWETSYRKVSPEDQAALLLENAEFAQWVGNLLEASTKDDKERYKHLIRMPCVAAMWHTYHKDQDASQEFWEAVRDDCNDTKDAPRRKLYKWLREGKIGAREAKERVGEREVFVHCLQAWNAWREGEDLPKFSYKKEMETPVVV